MAEQHEQLVDPAVSRAKFEREVTELWDRRWELHKRGWMLMDATYPKVFVIFAKPEIHPQAVLFGVEVDFANYDLWPLSLKLVNPFTRAPFTYAELKGKQIGFYRLRQLNERVEQEDFLQSEDPNGIPFVCLPGIREYHEHPAHTGDSWFLHRGKGVGTLYYLLEKLFDHGIQPVAGFQVNLQVQIGPYMYDVNKVLS